ncbi:MULTISPECIES: DUF6233 domain-containing protein [unclassified Streptomyces]|uniref:DUF6233 domain-containing protein n=1 Tax=unclassified Streptomyces TaxID=2593676 RepID=UPI000823CB36|nr:MULTISPECIES: DUF6233 domain-containing protein [unclassified Streptomyces]MYU00284.1 hypothetical protein [Streptomyces sp. SID8350]SCK63231.1 hypothetical protein YUWDRAFT_06859 [Streptomyces sp. AmelKG-D3]
MSQNVVRVTVIMPDGQELRACLYERRRAAVGWQYRVGITGWTVGSNGRTEPTEQRVWLEARYVRPLEGGDYSRIPTLVAPAADGRQAWTVQDLPHRPGHPGARLIHVIGCQPHATPLTLGQALDLLRQPRTVPCRECHAATSLPATADPLPPQQNCAPLKEGECHPEGRQGQW